MGRGFFNAITIFIQSAMTYRYTFWY